MDDDALSAALCNPNIRVIGHISVKEAPPMPITVKAEPADQDSDAGESWKVDR